MTMVENTSKSAVQNGLIIGAIISLNVLISALKIPVLSSFSILISIGIVVYLYFMTKKHRDQEGDGFLTFGQAFKYLFKVYFLGAIIGSLVLLIFTLMHKEFIADLINQTMMLYDKMNIPVDDATYNLLMVFFNPFSFALMNLFGGAIKGAFWGLILAAFLKKEKSIFEE